MSEKGSKAVKDGVQVIQGTPTAPITSPTLFLRLWRVTEGKEVAHARDAVHGSPRRRPTTSSKS